MECTKKQSQARRYNIGLNHSPQINIAWCKCRVKEDFAPSGGYVNSKGEGEENVFHRDLTAFEFVTENVDEDAQELE